MFAHSFLHNKAKRRRVLHLKISNYFLSRQASIFAIRKENAPCGDFHSIHAEPHGLCGRGCGRTQLGQSDVPLDSSQFPAPSLKSNLPLSVQFPLHTMMF